MILLASVGIFLISLLLFCHWRASKGIRYYEGAGWHLLYHLTFFPLVILAIIGIFSSIWLDFYYRELNGKNCCFNCKHERYLSYPNDLCLCHQNEFSGWHKPNFYCHYFEPVKVKIFGKYDAGPSDIMPVGW